MSIETLPQPKEQKKEVTDQNAKRFRWENGQMVEVPLSAGNPDLKMPKMEAPVQPMPEREQKPVAAPEDPARIFTGEDMEKIRKAVEEAHQK